MIKTGVLIAITASSAAAFSTVNILTGPGLKLRSARGPISIKMSEALDQDPDPEGRTKTKAQGGFAAGEELALKELDRRKAAGTNSMGGGASGSSKMEQGQSFEEYMKQRAAAAGGKVTDAAGNDITGVKPTYEVVDFMTYMYTDPKEQRKGVGAVSFSEIDRSVTGFQKQSTDWLKDDVEADSEAANWAAQKKAERAQEEAAAEARMQQWLKAAAEKKAKEGK